MSQPNVLSEWVDKLNTCSDVVQYVSFIHRFTERTQSIEEEVADKFSRTCSNRQLVSYDNFRTSVWYREEEVFDPVDHRYWAENEQKYRESQLEFGVSCEDVAFDIAEAIVELAREVREHDVEKQVEEDIKGVLIELANESSWHVP